MTDRSMALLYRPDGDALLAFRCEGDIVTGRVAVTYDEAPWYPSLRLFRQSTPDDWAGVMAQVATGLSALGRPKIPGHDTKG